ncbi:MAG: flagellar hook-basal body complex protein FliE [Burkholderiales bacterium]|nr:flagellar hook-basal body complex protein FliE [Burkholderiales bacterium]
MIEKATSNANIASMLQTLKAHQLKASGVGFDNPFEAAPEKSSFGDAIRQAVGQTNAAQMDAQNTSQAFERGDGIPLTDVVMKMQKASLSFEATLQVRNKVLKAYEEVLNMPV